MSVYGNDKVGGITYVYARYEPSRTTVNIYASFGRLVASICLDLGLIAIKGQLRTLSALFHLRTKFNAYLQHHCKEPPLWCNSQARGLGRRRLCRVEFFGRSEYLLCPNWQ